VLNGRKITFLDTPGHEALRARHEGCLVVDFVVGDRLLDVGRYELDLISELFGHDHHRLGVETLVDRNHQAQVHAGRNHLTPERGDAARAEGAFDPQSDRVRHRQRAGDDDGRR